MRKMKDSGIEWIGEIPEGWELRKGKSLYRVATGKLDANAENPDGDYPFFTCSMAPKRINSYSFDCEALLVAGNGLVGFTQYYKGKFDAYQRTYVLSDFRNVLPSFLRYYVSVGLPMEVQPKSIGSVIQFIKLGDLLNFNITLPSIEQQTIISNYLEFKIIQIDAILSKTRSSIEEYKKLKQAVITQAVTKGVRGEREMKDSGVEWIGEIPAEWKIQRFARVAEVKSNLVSPDNYLEYPQISPENIEKDSGKLLLPCRTVSEVGVISGNHLFYKGQILYSKIRPKLNKVCIAPFDGLCSADMYPIESKNDTRYIMYCILSNGFLQQVSMITENRVKMPKVNQVELSKILVAIPETIAEQKEIADYLDTKCAEIDGLIVKKEQLVKELESYKKSLIYEVVTGKREV